MTGWALVLLILVVLVGQSPARAPDPLTAPCPEGQEWDAAGQECYPVLRVPPVSADVTASVIPIVQAIDGDVSVSLGYGAYGGSGKISARGEIWVKSNVPWSLRATVVGVARLSFRSLDFSTPTPWRGVESGDEVVSGSPGIFRLEYEVRLDEGPRATISFTVAPR